ncbi:MAG: zinc ribbon domain-containing protein [Planctomycetes bacterium]|nr:zinc ribbon domain-containing protein [Planctomycetota bacterium]
MTVIIMLVVVAFAVVGLAMIRRGARSRTEARGAIACSQCRTANAEHAKFCSQCGASLRS